VVANVGSLVQPLTRTQYQRPDAYSEQFSSRTRISSSNGKPPWRKATVRPVGAGRVADYVKAQGMNSSTTFPTFLSVAGNTLEGTGAKTQLLAIHRADRWSLPGSTARAASQARLSALTNLLTLNSGVSLAQAGQFHNVDEYGRCQGARQRSGRRLAFETQFPLHHAGPATSAGGADHSRCSPCSGCGARFSSARSAASTPTPGSCPR